MLAQSGKWLWRDETNTLEFISQGGNVDRIEKKKRKGHQDFASKRYEKVTGNRSLYSSRHNVRQVTYSSRPLTKPVTDSSTFTLSDIKNRTLDLFTEVNTVSEDFVDLFYTAQFDNFLLHLLNYFHYFFSKCDMDAQPKHEYIQQGLTEVRKYAEVCCRVKVAQKLLGQAYSVLVMGLGLEEMHHMSCGLSRTSHTYKDRSIFETVYSYCSFLVWINFKRKDRPMVRQEIGRILRSDTFNPAIRTRNVTPLTELAKPTAGDDTRHQAILTPAQYRRTFGKRPAIKSIITQKSPVISSIIPSPKEESPQLFSKITKLPKTVHDYDNDDAIEAELRSEIQNLKVGILGDFQSLYNNQNLMILSEDKGEEEPTNSSPSDNLSDKITKEGPVSPTAQPSPGTDKVPRQSTTISHATTEAFIDDD